MKRQVVLNWGTVLIVLAVIACSSVLSSDKAESIIQSTPGMRPTDVVRIVALSEVSANESIARTEINGSVMNLKFRRYDDGWRWESVETKLGAWLANTEAVQEIREQQRAREAVIWAEKHKKDYISTIKAMDEYIDLLPRLRSDSFTAYTWVERKEQIAKIFRRNADPVDISDAWGKGILVDFDSEKRIATFVSSGVDQKQGTSDDVVCLAIGEPGWDDYGGGRAVFNYYKTWRVPEGLDSVVKATVDADETRSVTTEKVVKP